VITAKFEAGEMWTESGVLAEACGVVPAFVSNEKFSFTKMRARNVFDPAELRTRVQIP
jgi:hypothetical protein